MTVQEALDICFGKPYIVPCDVHEQAQQVIRDACEKQIPEKVLDMHESINEAEMVFYRDVMFGICPTCMELICSSWDNVYCGDCGQRLDWSDEE